MLSSVNSTWIASWLIALYSQIKENPDIKFDSRRAVALPTWHRQWVISICIYGTKICVLMFCVGKYYMRHVALASFFLLSVRSYSLCLFVCGFAAPHLIACHMQIVGQKANGAGLSMICFQHAILNYIYVCRHRHPVHTSRFIHVFCHASPLSLSLSLSTKVTSFILPLFPHSLVIIILHFPARNYTI